MTNSMNSEGISLTQYSHGAGCGCKIAPDVLSRILAETDSGASNATFPSLLVGHQSRDDAAAVVVADVVAEVTIAMAMIVVPATVDAETAMVPVAVAAAVMVVVPVVTIEIGVTSDPVPAVVGASTRGRRSPFTRLTPYISEMG